MVTKSLNTPFSSVSNWTSEKYEVSVQSNPRTLSRSFHRKWKAYLSLSESSVIIVSSFRAISKLIICWIFNPFISEDLNKKKTSEIKDKITKETSQQKVSETEDDLFPGKPKFAAFFSSFHKNLFLFMSNEISKSFHA